MSKFIALIALILCLAEGPIVGTTRAASDDDDFRRGLSAFNTGDYATALKIWRQLTEQGEPRPQASIGVMYHPGMAVPADDSEAAAWLRRAGEHGQVEGQLMLGILFYYGLGVPQSYVQAYAWCELAETNGNGDATLCRDAALEAIPDADREKAFRLVVELRGRQRSSR